MVTSFKEEKFKDNQLLVTNNGVLFYLKFKNDNLVKRINDTYLGNKFRFFVIRNNLNKGTVYVDWSNGLTRFEFECDCEYSTEILQEGYSTEIVGSTYNTNLVELERNMK